MTRTQTTTTNHFVRALVLLLALVLAAGTLIQGAGPAKAAYPGANGKIAFESERTTGRGVDNPTGDSEIFIMNPDGTGVRQLTKNTSDDFDPSYSAPGGHILFTTNRDGNTEIYVMDSDGKNQIRLTNTNNTVSDITPTFAPDGFSWAHERIENGNREIIYHAGAFEANITDNLANDRYPVFSPTAPG